jgi:hypothetical protein
MQGSDECSYLKKEVARGNLRKGKKEKSLDDLY